MMRYLTTFLAVLFCASLILSCNNDQATIDELNAILSGKNQKIVSLNERIDSLKQLSITQQETIGELRKKDLSLQMTQATRSELNASCACNTENVKLVAESIGTLEEPLFKALLCTFDQSCATNAEFSAYANEILLKAINAQPELFLKTLSDHASDINIKAVLEEIEAPLLESTVSREGRTDLMGIYGFEHIKKRVIPAYERGLREADIAFTTTDDCIFDQDTQTDSFLEGVEEFKNYIWNPWISTAKVVLSEKESLFIERGGCVGFGTSIRLEIMSVDTSLKEQKTVLKTMLDYAKHLPKSFDIEKLQSAIERQEYSLSEYSHGYGIFFNEQNLADNNYSISVRQQEGKTTLNLGHYIN